VANSQARPKHCPEGPVDEAGAAEKVCGSASASASRFHGYPPPGISKSPDGDGAYSQARPKHWPAGPVEVAGAAEKVWGSASASRFQG